MALEEQARRDFVARAHAADEFLVGDLRRVGRATSRGDGARRPAGSIVRQIRRSDLESRLVPR